MPKLFIKEARNSFCAKKLEILKRLMDCWSVTSQVILRAGGEILKQTFKFPIRLGYKLIYNRTVTLLQKECRQKKMSDQFFFFRKLSYIFSTERRGYVNFLSYLMDIDFSNSDVTNWGQNMHDISSQHVITVVDKVGGPEHLIQQTDLEGSAALKLDLSMDAPTIIMPRCSYSREFMQLDLGRPQLSNKFEWRGDDKGDAGAVHLDVLNIVSSPIR